MYEYKHLNNYKNEIRPEKSLVQDFIQAQKEITELESRINMLKGFVGKNKKINKYLWTNGLGNTVSILDIPDDYLLNLTKYLAKSPRTHFDEDMSKKLKALQQEINDRGLKCDELLILPGNSDYRNMNDICF